MRNMANIGEAQGFHRENLVLTCFFRSYTLAYPRTPTNVRTKYLPTFFGVCSDCRKSCQTASRKHNKARHAECDKYRRSTRISSRKPCAYLLLPFLHSGVPSYADECKNETSAHLFRRLLSVSRTSRHAESGKSQTCRSLCVSCDYFKVSR